MLKKCAVDAVTGFARSFVAGRDSRFIFRKSTGLCVPPLRRSGIYVHVPFCQQLCPYCPYNRIPYDRDAAAAYLKSVLIEIRHYAKQLPGLEVESVYFGGGTPTVLGAGLCDIIGAILTEFRVTGPLCIETNPADLTEEKVAMLREAGVNAVSLGVQSFNEKLRDTIGRRCETKKIHDALAWLEKACFDAVNIDLMFALPSQSMLDLKEDVALAASTFADQITAYPLFTFPYSEVGQYRKLCQVRMPHLGTRRKMYYLIYDYLTSSGFSRASVWSFKKNSSTPRYSSVTRERYIGFGPGAGSYYGSHFTLNTFSVQEYSAAVQARGHAVALEMPFTRKLSIAYDFYWRLYDTSIPKLRTIEDLSYSIASDKRLCLLLLIGKMLGFLDEMPDAFVLNKKGSFWLHLLQNYFSLRSVNTIWTAAKRDSWPQAIEF